MSMPSGPCPDCGCPIPMHLEDNPGRGYCLNGGCLDRPPCPSQVR